MLLVSQICCTRPGPTAAVDGNQLPCARFGAERGQHTCDTVQVEENPVTVVGTVGQNNLLAGCLTYLGGVHH